MAIVPDLQLVFIDVFVFPAHHAQHLPHVDDGHEAEEFQIAQPHQAQGPSARGRRQGRSP